MKKEPGFSAATLESISHTLGDAHTGSEIGRLLAQCRLPDPHPKMTKWKRLFSALVEEQNRKQCANHVIAFMHKAMAPISWPAPGAFESMRIPLNLALAFEGLELGEDGKIRRCTRASTLREAESRADLLRSRLRERRVHPDVLKFCTAELVQKNYFHAVLEASKSIASKIRKLTGLTTDGAELAQAAFGLGQGKPMLAINPLTTKTEEGEQRGFTNLLIGLFGTFRNPTAHAEKIYWPVNEQDALDILGLISLVHRKLDQVRKP